MLVARHHSMALWVVASVLWCLVHPRGMRVLPQDTVGLYQVAPRHSYSADLPESN